MHYYWCFYLNGNQTVFNYHSSKLLQVWEKNWWLLKISIVYKALCLRCTDSLVRIMSQTLAGSDIHLEFCAAKNRFTTSFGALDVELKLLLRRCPSNYFYSPGLFLMQEVLTSRRSLPTCSMTNVRNHSEASVFWKKKQTKQNNKKTQTNKKNLQNFPGANVQREQKILSLFTLLDQYSKLLTSW